MICLRCKSYQSFIIKSAGKTAVCKKCGHKDKYSRPSYENYHTERYVNKRPRTVFNDPMLSLIIKKIKLNKKDRVLEYGCGNGDYTYAFSRRSANVVGLDIDIDEATKKYGKKLFKKQKGELIKFSSNYFNKIVCINTIEHIHDFNLLLKEFYRVLKPTGKLFITTYDHKFMLHFIHNDPTHVIEWNKTGFTSLIAKFFSIDKVFNYGSFFNYFPLNWFLVKLIKPELCVIAHKS